MYRILKVRVESSRFTSRGEVLASCRERLAGLRRCRGVLTEAFGLFEIDHGDAALLHVETITRSSCQKKTLG